MRITLYLHGSKESAYDAGYQAGLRDSALKMFMYAGTEHAIEYEVDQYTGEAKAVKIDGRDIAK